MMKNLKGIKAILLKDEDIPKGVSDFGKWHKVEIIVNEDKCSFLVNGKITNGLSNIRTADKQSIKNGKFALGFEGAEILLKNIQLMEYK